ncbi:MAG: hypothetical protein AB9866_07100 [Syntrophobacteraceae bacterium]
MLNNDQAMALIGKQTVMIEEQAIIIAALKNELIIKDEHIEALKKELNPENPDGPAREGGE